MKLIWNGHSCYTVETESGTVVLDPYEDNYVPGLAPLQLQADCVYCSHQHADHGASQKVTLTGAPCHVTVETIDTFHDPEQGALRGTNTIHILSAEGMRVAHLGDLGCTLTPEQKEKLQGLDALLIPVGGFYTIDAHEAKALVDELKPRVVIPMHYRGDGFGFDVIDEVRTFTSLCDHVVYAPENYLELTSETPEQICVLTLSQLSRR